MPEWDEHRPDPDAQDKIDEDELDGLVTLKQEELRRKLEQLPRHRREDFRAYFYESNSYDAPHYQDR